MPKRLFLLCPTDCLESIINNRFNKYENYFYTSLGNSFLYDRETIECIKGMVRKNNIREIFFVLSIDNQIVLDALGNQDFYDISKLRYFYNEITNQRKHSEVSWHTNNLQFSILSYYLNKKIKELHLELNHSLNYLIKIRGEIYDKQDHIFRAIYSDLICIEKHHLN